MYINCNNLIVYTRINICTCTHISLSIYNKTTVFKLPIKDFREIHCYMRNFISK